MTRGVVKMPKIIGTRLKVPKLTTWVIIRSMFENYKMVQC